MPLYPPWFYIPPTCTRYWARYDSTACTWMLHSILILIDSGIRYRGIARISLMIQPLYPCNYPLVTNLAKSKIMPTWSSSAMALRREWFKKLKVKEYLDQRGKNGSIPDQSAFRQLSFCCMRSGRYLKYVETLLNEHARLQNADLPIEYL